MINSREFAKQKYESIVLEFIKSHKELEKVLDEKYTDYTSVLNYNPNTSNYTFNITFNPKKIGPSVTITFSFDKDLNIIGDDGYIENLVKMLEEN
jgi:hypothetical protein